MDPGSLVRRHTTWLGVFSALSVIAGLVAILLERERPWVFAVGVLAYALGVPVLLGTLSEGWWKGVDEHLRRMRGYYRRALAKVVEESTTSASLARLVPQKHLRAIVSELCGPVVEETLKAQGAHPVVTDLELALEVVDVETAADLFTEIAVVKREARWKALLPSATTRLGSLVRPTLVCTSGVHEKPTVVRLAECGLVELLWPLPARWIDDVATEIGTLRNACEWLEVPTLELHCAGERLMLDGSTLAPESEAEIVRALEPHFGRDVDGEPVNLHAVSKELSDCLLRVWTVKDPDREIDAGSGADPRIGVRFLSTYRVCVKGRRPTEILYRYELPFSQPAFVQSIRFRLGSEVARRWELDPASVRCAFPLLKPSARWDRLDQHLTWQIAEQRGTAFLPGHGVAFLWRPRVPA